LGEEERKEMIWAIFIGTLLLIYAVIMMFVFLFQSHLFFSPTYYRDEEKFEALAEFLTPLMLPAEDETMLEGVLYEPAKASDKIILYFGGVQQDSVALVTKFAAHYPHMPFITYNYRGYGKSEGKPSQSKLFVDAMHIYDDLVLVYNYKPENIILMGYSLGSGVASFLGSQRQVREILLMAPYDSVLEVIKKRYPFSGIHWVLKQKFPSVDFVPHIDVPVHIYAASDDKVVNIKHAKMLKSHVNNLAGFYEYTDVGHNDILFNADVVEHIKQLLEK
jgi:pimeloyl-ACP methyl ester carboxylesterase